MHWEGAVKLFAMGYNRREFLEPYKIGATSNGLGSFAGTEGLAATFINLSVSTGDQGSLGATDEPGYMNTQSSIVSSPQKKSNLASTTSSSSFNPVRTNLNPNAEEFVPKAYRPATIPASGNVCDNKSLDLSGTVEKENVGSRLDRTNSSNSNTSDDEYRRFCHAQLPDDLMPDFDFGDFLDSSEYEESASLDVSSQSSLATNWTGAGVRNALHRDSFTYDDRVNQNPSRATSYSPPGANGTRFTNLEGSTSSTGPSFVRPYMPEMRPPAQQPNHKRQPPWNDSNESVTSFTDWGAAELAFPDDLGEVIDQAIDPVSILAAEFPGFATDSLAEIYFANGGDLTLTMDMLSELELQNEAPTKPFHSPPTPAPPSPRDFPALSGLDTMNGSALSGRTTVAGDSRAVPDFAAVVRKQAAQQAAQLQFERNVGLDVSLGAVRGLTHGPGVGGFPRDARATHTERLDPFHLHGHDIHQPLPTWLETGDSVSNMYSDMREEARDHARVRNAYFDQARQAYLAGNKALAKELSAKGQWHNEQMKAAHSKAGEAIFWQRNSNAFVNSNSTPGQPRLLDLHGLHVGEAIPVLKREIAQLRFNVSRTRQREQVYICVGTGHHTKGLRTPSRLPTAVQRYLIEEEHLQFTEPQPGMLRIIIR